MKTKSLHSFTATVALIAFIASLLVTHDPLAGFAVLTAAMVALIAIQEYSPRNYFVVISQTPARKPAAHQHHRPLIFS